MSVVCGNADTGGPFPHFLPALSRLARTHSSSSSLVFQLSDPSTQTQSVSWSMSLSFACQRVTMLDNESGFSIVNTASIVNRDCS